MKLREIIDQETMARRSTIGGEKYGIEVELENTRSISSSGRELWRGVTDHSLRGGFELVSIPLPYSQVSIALTELPSDLRKHSSHRTSVHIHSNCMHLEIGEIAYRWALWLLNEAIITDLLCPERKHNNFCASPLYSFANWSIFSDPLTILRGTDNRYQSVSSYNLLNVGKSGVIYGTLEWRAFTLPASSSDIMTYVNVIKCLNEFAKELYAEERPLADVFRMHANDPLVFARKALEMPVEIDAIRYKQLLTNLWNKGILPQMLSPLTAPNDFTREEISFNQDSIWSD